MRREYELNSSKPFFSLSWKIFINLVLVLTFLHLGFTYYTYSQQLEKAEQQRSESVARDLQLLSGIVNASYERLLDVGGVIPVITTTAVDFHSLDDFKRVLHQEIPSLIHRGYVDAVYVYGAQGEAVIREGVDAPIAPEVVQQVLENEEPMHHFYCRSECLRFVILPIALPDESVGALVVGREMRDIILEFKQQTGRDIGLALRPANSQNIARQWRLNLKYLTQKQENIELINKLVREQNIPDKGGVFDLKSSSRRYQIVLQPLDSYTYKNGYWVLIEDRTEIVVATQKALFKQLFYAIAGLIVAVLILLAILHSPLRILNEISRLLPLLAGSSYEQIRLRLNAIKRRNLYADELDVLKYSTLELSDQLERMEHSLLERAQNLTERSVQLEAERDFVTSLLNTAEAIILTLDKSGRIMTLNRYGREVLGLSADDASMLSFADLPHEAKCYQQHEKAFAALSANDRQKVQVESGINIISGKMMQVSWLHSALDIAGNDSQFLSIGLDFTERQHAEGRLRWLANHDPLTALPNRLLFNETVDKAIKKAEPQKHLVAVLFCDLDSFKDVNDSLGHPVGDELLQQAAERIQHVIDGYGMLARLGGDEFTVLLEGQQHYNEIQRIAEQLLRAFRESFFIDGYEIFSTISIGIALCPDHSADVNSLIQYADVAMFEAKEGGKNQVRLYHNEQGSQRYERFSLVNDLRRALERDEFRIHYQPQIDARNGTVMGVEALLRWQHKEAGMISPAKFIPLAEEQGLIVPIGDWVLHQACLDGHRWHQQGLDMRIGVNVAGQQIMHESLLPAVEHAILHSGIDPTRLDLEVTENFLLRQPEITIPKLHKFREMGLSLSMDDFGTGFSSLSYLKKLPLTTLKIDKGFINDIGQNSEGEAIVKAIIALAKSLGLDSIAEGVETSEQLSYLRQQGCHLIQGFYFSKPLPVDELPDFVMNQAVDISFE